MLKACKDRAVSRPWLAVHSLGNLIGSLTCHIVKREATLTEEEDWRLCGPSSVSPTVSHLV